MTADKAQYPCLSVDIFGCLGSYPVARLTRPRIYITKLNNSQPSCKLIIFVKI